MTIAVGLKLIPPGQGSKLREYYIRFEGSMYGASRVRIDANRVPFTVGCVDVNHGDGFDMLRICAADPGYQKPVVMFRLNQYALNGKELSFNVI